MGKWRDRKLILLYLLTFGCLIGFTDNIKYLPYCGRQCGERGTNEKTSEKVL